MSAFSLIDSIATDVLVSGKVQPAQVEPKLRELEKSLFEPVGRRLMDKLLACVERARLNPEDTVVFLDGLDALSGHLESLNDSRSGQTRAKHSSLYLQAVSISAQEPIEYDTAQSREIIDTFIEEYGAQLQSLEQQLWLLQMDPTRKDAAHSAFRCVHTLKGNCAVLEMKTGRTLAHEMENVLSRGRETPLDGLQLALLLRALDVLREIGARMANHCKDAPKTFPLVPDEFASVLDLVRRAGRGDSSAADSGPELARTKSGTALQPVDGAAATKIPLQDLFQRMIRIARDVARREEKEIDIQIEADATLRDRPVPARLADPLLHLASNAVAHGIASPAERAASGKPPRGQIVFGARLNDGTLALWVSDDGDGLNSGRIRARACERGLLKPNDNISEPALHALLFTPGFSTKAAVSEIAGRGVGLDVVKTTIEELGGIVKVSTVPGSSTTFELRLRI